MPGKNITGPKIRAARKNAAISQERLAARLQVMGIRIDRSGIAKIETGRRPVSDIEIFAIARILGVQVDRLFADGGDWFRNQEAGIKNEDTRTSQDSSGHTKQDS